ncbi:methyltransferase [Spirillospora sp. NPDC047279]|uniref:methyltransferase n=1 Tax=Spirillospora sp. NPDC047279 TaxID=3155478 RepID=UPI003411ACBA
MTSEPGNGRTLLEIADLVTPMTIRVAATLGIADHITAGLQTAEQLAAETDTDADALNRVLLHLVGAGILTKDGTGRYGLTGVGEQLRMDDRLHLNGGSGRPPWLDMKTAIGRAELSFVRLLDTVRTGEVAYHRHYGTTFWQDLSDESSWDDELYALAAQQIVFDGDKVAKAYDWGALGDVVDVGGGDGTLLVTLLRAHPGLRGTLVDRAAARASQTIREAGLDDRAQTIVGSFFDLLPRGAGGYILSRVQSDWCDADVRTILGRCAEAAGPGGKVFVVDEFATDEQAQADTATDLRMLVYFGGRERTRAQVRDLAGEAGLSEESIIRVGEWTIMKLTVC